MKNTFRYILFSVALLAPVVGFAQTRGEHDPAVITNNGYNNQNGVATGKSVSGPNGQNEYTITLETFATGESITTSKRIPADIILVLDVSGSMNETIYEPRASQAYSYDSYGNNTYYYLYEDGEYYEVHRTTSSGGWQTYYRLYFEYEDDWGRQRTRYLAGTGDQRDGPYTTSSSATIYTGVLYESTNTTKMKALQDAVAGFIDTIVEDDAKLDLEEGEVGNQISIVKFAGSQQYSITYFPDSSSEDSITEGDHRREGSNTNYVEVVQQFKPVSTGATDLKNAVNRMQAGGATRADLGMTKAKYLFAQLATDYPDRESAKTVVFFTDGEPTPSSGYNTGTADATVLAAYTLKQTYGATVYSVGVFSAKVDSRVDSYMSYVSSDQPDAQSVGTGGAPGGYYFKAGGDMNLEDIFKTIGENSGGAEKTIPASTQVRDNVSSSFNLPAGFSADDVSLYTVDVKTNGASFYSPSDVDYNDHKKDLTIINVDDPDSEAGKARIAEAEADDNKVAIHIGKVTVDGDEVDQLYVQGFDYSRADSNPTNHVFDGNWVGERMYSSGGSQVNEYYGRKLVIEFNIKPEGEATGGVGTNTNAKGSGVYVIGDDGKYASINDYEPPHTTLPVTIKIMKVGLIYGESATFEIKRIRPKGWDETKTLEENIKNIQYDVTGTGKPLPGDGDWITWTKVILTQKDESSTASVVSANRLPVVKEVVALDPYWVYKVEEDNWGWAYEYNGNTSMTTSNTAVNPFNFVNTDKEGVPKHAEAVTINHFREVNGKIQIENYKSGKVESF